ncbi:MAG: hypothetical protein J5911_06285 [Clostridia bacterium]|nr:hypothetical protein [Clostridia bacterium]
MSEDLKCPICGKPTRVYMGNARKDRLCPTHADMLKNGEIEQCPDCGKWHYVTENCECKKHNKVYYFDPTEEEQERNNNNIVGENCIDCGKPSNGYFFCKKCYPKYKNKSVYIKITDCKNIEILNAEYEGTLTTKDGHKVKSHVERDIDNYLFLKNIPHAYESTLDVDGKPEHEIKPDFYLPNYLGEDKDVYIEYFGMIGTKDGDKKIKFKMPIYKDKQITLICLYPKDDSNIESALKRKLNKDNIKIKQINFENE